MSIHMKLPAGYATKYTQATFGERFKEHHKAPSPIYDHSNITGHNVTMENFSIEVTLPSSYLFI